MEQTEGSYWWYRARREIIASTIVRTVPRGSDIIDFGCGTGCTAGVLKHLGYKVVVADISEEVLEACRNRGLTAINLETEDLADHAADCVLAGDVLEHLHDDVSTLWMLHRKLRPRGLLLATVPAYEFLWSGEDYVSEHVRRYTRSMLKRRLRSGGFQPLRCSYFNSLLFPLVLAVTLGKRMFFPREMYHSDVKPLPEWQNELLYRLFAFERHLLRWLTFPVGTSLLIVAQAVNLEQTA
jgi:SAM-dependent methyltransferase